MKIDELEKIINEAFEVKENISEKSDKKILDATEERIFVKIVSPNFDLEYGLKEEDIEKRFKKIIRYSNPDQNKKTLFIWPEGVFSGYSYNEILNFKELILDNFSKNHLIILGTNMLDPSSGNFYNSMIIIPISKNKAIHLHHWIFLSIIVLFLNKYFKNKKLLEILIGFFLGLIIQGLTYNDAYDFIIQNPYYKFSNISSLSIKMI